MPGTNKPTKASSGAAEKIQDESSTHETSSSSDQEQDPEVFIQPSKAQLLPNMFMPYIEGPKMDWMVNHGLYHISYVASSNQMKSGLDLTCLQASSTEISTLMNGTMQYRPRMLWLSTPQQQRSFTGTSFGFFGGEKQRICIQDN